MALWATQRLLPLVRGGRFAQGLSRCRAAGIALHARLRAGGVPTFVFSNTNEIAISHIRRRFAFFAHFDGYILSFEQGTVKPDAALYESKRLGRDRTTLEPRAPARTAADVRYR